MGCRRRPTIRRPRRRLLRLQASLLLGAALVLMLPATGRSQMVVDKRLQLSVQPEFGVVRGHAPLALSVTLRWNSPELIEGRLQLEWFANSSRLGRFVSPDLALADSKVQLNVLLPPSMLANEEAVFSVEGKFLGETAVYDLDVHDIALQPDWRRILLVGICETPGAGAELLPNQVQGQRDSSLSGKFRLEPFFATRFNRRELMVDSTEVAPEDVPGDPLKMTAFDLFVVSAESLPKLKRPQRESLLMWVRAGGSLCVFADALVGEEQVGWMNRLVGSDAADPEFLRTAEGRVVYVDEEKTSPARFNRELGRVVVCVDDPIFNSAAWQQAVLFLWKVRQDRRSTASQGQLWRVSVRSMGRDFQLPAMFAPERIWQRKDLTRLLLPDTVRGLPLATVAVILSLFLLAIAPGDYFLLGWLKRRRWTWILFPAVSLLFTAFTMWLARSHLGETSYDNAITVIDLGRNGDLVRTSRFDLFYAAANRELTDEIAGELMVPLDAESASENEAYFERFGQLDYEPPWIISGRIPQRYTVTRQIRQWAPRLARSTIFGAGETAMGSQGHVIQLTGSSLSGPDRMTLQSDPGIPSTIVSLAEAITCRPESGFFSVVSQISPTCAGNWEDLALLDPTDARQQVTIRITNPVEGQYMITRQFEWERD